MATTDRDLKLLAGEYHHRPYGAVPLSSWTLFFFSPVVSIASPSRMQMHIAHIERNKVLEQNENV